MSKADVGVGFIRPAGLINQVPTISHKSKVLILLLILGFFLRLSYLLEFRQTPFFNASLLSGFDQHTWDDLGFKSLAHPWFVDGQPFYQAPGYAYFLSLVYLFFGAHNYLAVGIIQILLDLLTAFFLFLIGRRLWNDWVGISACGIYVFYRPFIYYSVTILSDSFILFTSVFCLFVLYWVLEPTGNYTPHLSSNSPYFPLCKRRVPLPSDGQRGTEGDFRRLKVSPQFQRWFLAGLVFGLAAITKPT
ncbi:MAG: glycosyltransferase family 39 protein, partial [Candidatus Omnitrophota bacterium]